MTAVSKLCRHMGAGGGAGGYYGIQGLSALSKGRTSSFTMDIKLPLVDSV